MRLARRMRLAVPAAAVLGLTLFTASMAWQVPAASAASGPLDAQSSELVRLINGARSAYGKSALRVDTLLASKARDGAIPCPDNSAENIAGRAQDFAAFGNMDHRLRNCDASGYQLSSTLFVNVLQSAWGYGSVGEIDLDNGGYGNGAYLYSVAGTSKTSKTWQTWTYSTTGHGMLGWKSSSSHWNIIIGSYDRVGCGGWASGSTYYYDCVFAKGGSGATKSPPTTSPFDNPLPTPKPTPVPTPKPTAKPTTAPVTQHGSPPTACGSCSQATASSAAAPSTVPSASPSVTVAGVQDAGSSAEPGGAQLAAIQNAGGGIPPAGDSSGLAVLIARLIAVVAGSGALILAACYLLQSVRRRRRETAL